MDHLCSCKSEISNACNVVVVEGRCLQAMKIVHYYANGWFDWLISGHQSDNPLRDTVWKLQKIYVCLSCGASKATRTNSFLITDR